MENKSARDRAEEIVSKLKHQARILGSSGKGYGDFARVNREAARLIQELLEATEMKDRMIVYYKVGRDMHRENEYYYAHQLESERKEKRGLEEKLHKMREEMNKKRKQDFLKWRKRK